MHSSVACADEIAGGRSVIFQITPSQVSCPQCGVRGIKNEACIHMDLCPCGSHWCFLCGRSHGNGPGQCPKNRGCDQQSIYLENHTGWDSFNLPGETPALGSALNYLTPCSHHCTAAAPLKTLSVFPCGRRALQELLRRRQAFFVRQIKEAAEPALWGALEEAHCDLLKDTPCVGRSVSWDEIDTAQYPMFGPNAPQEGEDPAAVEARMQAHWEELRQADVLAERGRRRARQLKMVLPGFFSTLLAALVVGSSYYQANYAVNPVTEIKPPAPVPVTCHPDTERLPALPYFVGCRNGKLTGCRRRQLPPPPPATTIFNATGYNATADQSCPWSAPPAEPDGLQNVTERHDFDKAPAVFDPWASVPAPQSYAAWAGCAPPTCHIAPHANPNRRPVLYTVALARPPPPPPPQPSQAVQARGRPLLYQPILHRPLRRLEL